ncbi:MAG: glycosyltransferase family 2 protein [Polaribacter sp.]
MSNISLAAIILTYNEEMHLNRCLDSLKNICDDIVIVDSFSNDNTELIAKNYKVRFFQNKWINYSNQFNWGIDNTDIKSDWILRIDADEYLSDKLIFNLKNDLHNVSNDVNGILIDRLMYFMGRPLKRGGMYPIKHLKIWRKGHALCEKKWMDERMKLLDGKNQYISGDLVDNNLNNLSWWIDKHNGYATREAIDFLNLIHNFSNEVTLNANFFGNGEERRRSLKKIYLKMPLFIRPFLFFFIRYFIQGGFLEGKRGFIWSILQCFWYRFLVDVKIYEVTLRTHGNKQKIIEYFKNEFNYDLTHTQ